MNRKVPHLHDLALSSFAPERKEEIFKVWRHIDGLINLCFQVRLILIKHLKDGIGRYGSIVTKTLAQFPHFVICDFRSTGQMWSPYFSGSECHRNFLLRWNYKELNF